MAWPLAPTPASGTGVPVALTNVKAGNLSDSSTDAVNGSQLFATNQNVATNTANIGTLGAGVAGGLGGGASYDPATGTFTGPSYALSSGSYGNVGAALQAIDTTANAGWNLLVNGGQATNVAPGSAVNLTGDSNVTVGTATPGTVAFGLAPDIALTSVNAGGSVLDASGLAIAGGPALTATGLNASNTVISNLADGVAVNDAATVGQVNAAVSTISAQGDLAVKYGFTDLNGNGVYDAGEPVDRTALTLGNAGTPVALTNVKAGALSDSSTDAVNGAQLFATNQAVSANTVVLGNLGASAATGLGGGSSYDPSTGILTTDLNVGGASTAA